MGHSTKCGKVTLARQDRIPYPSLGFLALIVQVAHDAEFGLILLLVKGIVNALQGTQSTQTNAQQVEKRCRRRNASYPGLKLLALIVQVAHDAEVGLALVLEEGVMEDLVVNVQLAHLGLHLVLLLLLQFLILFLHVTKP